jgi:hypothetical protein
MANMLLPMLLIGAYFAWWYWNRARKVQAAGGADEHAQQMWRRTFGLDPGEKIEQVYQGLFYLGPLRPDISPDKVDKVLDALSGTTTRGANLMFAITNRDRLALAIEQGEHTKMKDKVDALKGDHFGSDPYRVYGNSPKPSVRLGQEIYGSHPKFPKPGEAPKRGSMTGKLEHCVLVEIQAAGDEPQTVWIDPLGAKAICAWAELPARVSAA